MIYRAFYIKPNRLEDAFEILRQPDEMGGWKIDMIKDLGDQVMIVATRSHSYPYIEYKVVDELQFMIY